MYGEIKFSNSQWPVSIICQRLDRHAYLINHRIEHSCHRNVSQL